MWKQQQKTKTKYTHTHTHTQRKKNINKKKKKKYIGNNRHIPTPAEKPPLERPAEKNTAVERMGVTLPLILLQPKMY